MLVSYIDNKKSGKKNVIVLTAMHDQVKVTNDQWKKPHVHVMNDQTKGGVDFVDLVSINHSTRIKSKRWPWIELFSSKFNQIYMRKLLCWRQINTCS